MPSLEQPSHRLVVEIDSMASKILPVGHAPDDDNDSSTTGGSTEDEQILTPTSTNHTQPPFEDIKELNGNVITEMAEDEAPDLMPGGPDHGGAMRRNRQNSETEASTSTRSSETASQAPTKRQRTARRLASSSASPPAVGSDEQTQTHGTVLKYGRTVEETMKRVALTPKMVQFRTRPPNTWAATRCFSNDDYLAAGHLLIPPNTEKSTANAKENTYVYYVIEGTVQVKIHTSNYVLSPGGSFMVPRGNNFRIRNISSQDAKLFFTHARKSSPYADTDDGPSSPSSSSLIHTIFSRFLERPSSRASILIAFFLQRFLQRASIYHSRALTWYDENLSQYHIYATPKRLYLFFFLLGLLCRRLPIIGNPPFINVQFVWAGR